MTIIPNAAEDMNRVARVLGGAARVAYHGRAIIAQEQALRELVVEVSQLLDAIAGVYVTNPGERVEAHMHAIDGMVANLPLIDPGNLA